MTNNISTFNIKRFPKVIFGEKELSQLILKYFKNENKYNKFVFNGYKSLKAYDYKNNCERYLNLINKINY